MEFAVDSLKKESVLPQATQQNLASIQEDIQSINKLIHYFLLYYKTNTNKLKLNNVSADLIVWLTNITNKHKKLSKIKVTFSQPQESRLTTCFDAYLLKHSVDNLMTNALKFAKNDIYVNLDTNNHHIQIHVDDDAQAFQ